MALSGRRRHLYCGNSPARGTTTKQSRWAPGRSSLRCYSRCSVLLGARRVALLERKTGIASSNMLRVGTCVQPSWLNPNAKTYREAIASTRGIILSARYLTGSSTPHHESGLFIRRRCGVDAHGGSRRRARLSRPVEPRTAETAKGDETTYDA